MRDLWKLFEGMFKAKYGWKFIDKGKAQDVQSAFKDWMASAGQFAGNGAKELFPSDVTPEVSTGSFQVGGQVMTEAEVRALIKDKDPNATEDSIQQTLSDYRI